jgi:organic hydroperoxide reductase OsmC/OhrA
VNEKPQVKKEYKPHSFSSNVRWTGSRTWVAGGETSPEIPGGPPPVFGGAPGRWSPEEFMLASVNCCHLSSFISYSMRKGFEFVSFESSIEGTLEHNGTSYSFTRMVVRPKITVKSEADVETARQYLERAHQICFMRNSVCADVVMEPEITVAE